MKKKFLLIIFIIAIKVMLAQTTFVKRNFISFNVLQMALNGELGVTYDRILSEKKCISVSYGHRFWNFNYVVYGGREDNTGMGYKYLPQTGDVIKFSLKIPFKGNSFNNMTTGYTFPRIGFAYLHTPQFWWRDGSIGESNTRITLMSKDKYLGFLGGGWGMQVASKKIFFDTFLCLGAYIGAARVHKYKETWINGTPISDKEKVYFSESAYPAVELGVKFGFGL